MSILYKARSLLSSESRLFALITRELTQKDIDPREAARLSAYGRAFEKAGLVFNEAWHCGLREPAAFLSLHALCKSAARPPDLPDFFEEKDLRDICVDTGRSRSELTQEAKKAGHSCLDAYLLTDANFRAVMNEKGEAVKGTMEALVAAGEDNTDGALVFAIDSCSLTVGLLSFFINTAAERLEVVKGTYHPKSKSPPVNLIRDTTDPFFGIVMAEIIFKKGGKSSLPVEITYLGDPQLIPLIKAKP